MQCLQMTLKLFSTAWLGVLEIGLNDLEMVEVNKVPARKDLGLSVKAIGELADGKKLVEMRLMTTYGRSVLLISIFHLQTRP